MKLRPDEERSNWLPMVQEQELIAHARHGDPIRIGTGGSSGERADQTRPAATVNRLLRRIPRLHLLLQVRSP